MIAVLDASVILKTLVQEDGSDRAERLIAAGRVLHAPELIVLETVATLTKKARRREIPAPLAHRIALTSQAHVAGGLLLLHPDADLVPDAISLSLHLNHALYDCLYLALAVRLGIRLVTADRRFHDKLRTTEFAASIHPL